MPELSDQLRDASALLGSIEPEAIEFIDRVEEFSKVAQALSESNHPLSSAMESEDFMQKLAISLDARRLMENARSGFGSLILDMVASPFKRYGPKSVKRVVRQTLRGTNVGLHAADEAAGKVLSKLPGGSVFAEQQAVKLPGQGGKYVEQTVHRATAPLSKAQKVVVPVLATLGALSVAEKLQRRKEMVNEQRELMQKAASAIDQLTVEVQNLRTEKSSLQEKLAVYQRKETSVEIATEMASRGLIAEGDISKTASKLAESSKDLTMVKEGLSAFHGICDLGKVHDTGKPAAGDGVDPLTSYLQSCI